MEKLFIYKKGLGLLKTKAMYHFDTVSKFSNPLKKVLLSDENPHLDSPESYGYDGQFNYHNYEMACSDYDKDVLEIFYHEGFVRAGIYSVDAGVYGEVSCDDLEKGKIVAKKLKARFNCLSIEITVHDFKDWFFGIKKITF